MKTSFLSIAFGLVLAHALNPAQAVAQDNAAAFASGGGHSSGGGYVFIHSIGQGIAKIGRAHV